jgi:hypothetical protein
MPKPSGILKPLRLRKRDGTETSAGNERETSGNSAGRQREISGKQAGKIVAKAILMNKDRMLHKSKKFL